MSSEPRDNFRQQAEWCARLGSPFTARLCETLHRRLTTDSAFGATLLNWPGDPGADAIALRACGALNFHARAGHPALTRLYPPNPLPSEHDLWEGVAAAIHDLDAPLTRFLDSAPQTNEVARSALLLPGYMRVAELTDLPLSIREMGASAGLNLAFDRYAYDYGDFTWGDADSRVRIACEWRGPIPRWPDALVVSDRRGCDINPIDIADPQSRERMLAYIWPDQGERWARAEAALELAAQETLTVEAIDAARFAERELAAAAPQRALVLSHTIFWQYLPSETQSAIGNAIAAAATRATKAAPLAWLRVEPEAGEARGAVLRLSIWPDGPVDERLALASFHGQWIEWKGRDA